MEHVLKAPLLQAPPLVLTLSLHLQVQQMALRLRLQVVTSATHKCPYNTEAARVWSLLLADLHVTNKGAGPF